VPPRVDGSCSGARDARSRLFDLTTVAQFALRLNTLDGYTDRMAKPESIAQAGLVGWRKVIADSVAPRAASRTPVSEERLRAAIGAAFFLLSLYYVASTSARMIKSAQRSSRRF
jgi:hypothetical protein